MWSANAGLLAPLLGVLAWSAHLHSVSAVRISETGAADDNPGLDALREEFEDLVHPFKERATALAERMAAGKEGVQPQYDEAFFRETCDLSEHERETFDSPEYKLLENQVEDDKNWQVRHKCVNPGLGETQPALQVNDFQGSDNACARLCAAKMAESALKGKVVCCMHQVDAKLCEMHVGWQSLKTSSYGTGVLMWFRKQKKARLMLAPGMDGPFKPDSEVKELTDAEGGQETVQRLVSEVNDISIDGILNNLLSFYICMRWVPDKEFMDLATFELREVTLDERTPKKPQVTQDEIIDMYLNSDLTPLRCSSGINVQDVTRIDHLLVSLNTSSAPMNRLYSYSVEVQQAGRSWFSRVNNLKQAMHFDGEQDSVYVQDMRVLARQEDALPWPTFVRSSNYYSHHTSQPKNAFMICFGPRTASFPHKREGGGHILADANMAGCNGFWDRTSMVDHMSRIKKLFAPEMCFTYALKKELKQQFLRTFVSMNEEFENAMANRYSKKVHVLDPTTGFDFDAAADVLEPEDPARITNMQQKYARTAGLVGNAHAKWIICPTKPEVTGKIGVEDNFFREPRAYEKWIGQLNDETSPECRTLEDSTGCAVCVVAVKDEHGCHVRMNVTLANIFKAASDEKYPFLRSQYSYEEQVQTGDGRLSYEVRQDQGICMVRKSAATLSEASRSGDVQDLKDAFFNVNDSDAIVKLISTRDPGEGGRVDSQFRFPVRVRRSKYEEVRFLEELPPDNHIDRLLETINRETFSDPVEEWSQKFVFTADVGEEQNRPKHKVDYFVSCPCSQTNFEPSTHFARFGSLGFAEYWNR